MAITRLPNFNAGPSAMPQAVLERIQRELLDFQGRGLSVLEMSHRSDDFMAIAARAEQLLRTLLSIPDNYQVLFMQGGANAQFSLAVSNLDIESQVAYANTGYWSKKAITDAERLTQVAITCELIEKPQRKIPSVDQWQLPDSASYLHITDNETIDGVVFDEVPVAPFPLVCDMSSSILSKPIDIASYGMIYAGAQKNIGPAGITVIIIRDDLLERSREQTRVPPVFNYAAMSDSGSMLNTPPTFSWYAACCVFEWLMDQGGLEAVAQRNREQAAKVYQCIDESSSYDNQVALQNRSIMNVPFDLRTPDLVSQFLKGATDRGLIGLKGHKSRGGIRASLYNGVTDQAVDALIDYMSDFSRKQA